MNKKENQGIIIISIGGLLFLASMIVSATFNIQYGGYIFTGTSLLSLVLMSIGMKKIIQHTVSKR